jgi:hypothetical protein
MSESALAGRCVEREWRDGGMDSVVAERMRKLFFVAPKGPPVTSAAMLARCAPRARAVGLSGHAGRGVYRRPASSAAAATPTPPPPPPHLPRPPPPPPPRDLLSLLRRGARTTHAAAAVWRALLRPGAFAVDATAGRGGDTVALARLCGPRGRVLALDVQAEALEATAAMLADASKTETALAPVDLRLACHSSLGELLRAPDAPWAGRAPSVIAFNLGFLPGSAPRPAAAAAVGVEEKEEDCVTTTPATTLPALTAAAAALAPGGAITVASYVGHAGGEAEAAAVEAALSDLDPGEFTVVAARLLNRPAAPRLAVAWKKG